MLLPVFIVDAGKRRGRGCADGKGLGMAAEFIAWIASWGAEEIQAAMAVFGTVIGSVIAFFGWRISRHSAYGAKPVSVVAAKIITWSHNSAHELSCEIEIWNMHKYPIVIRDCVFTTNDLPFERLQPLHFHEDERWHVSSNTLYRTSDNPTVVRPDEHVILRPAGRFTWNREAPFKKSVKWTITYFDPRRSKEYRLQGRDVFDRTGLQSQGL
jgi:hypothetical protein